jgi:hypothetical protein
VLDLGVEGGSEDSGAGSDDGGEGCGFGGGARQVGEEDELELLYFENRKIMVELFLLAGMYTHVIVKVQY